jgi:hypothetical protein
MLGDKRRRLGDSNDAEDALDAECNMPSLASPMGSPLVSYNDAGHVESFGSSANDGETQSACASTAADTDTANLRLDTSHAASCTPNKNDLITIADAERAYNKVLACHIMSLCSQTAQGRELVVCTYIEGVWEEMAAYTPSSSDNNGELPWAIEFDLEKHCERQRVHAMQTFTRRPRRWIDAATLRQRIIDYLHQSQYVLLVRDSNAPPPLLRQGITLGNTWCHVQATWLLEHREVYAIAPVCFSADHALPKDTRRFNSSLFGTVRNGTPRDGASARESSAYNFGAVFEAGAPVDRSLLVRHVIRRLQEATSALPRDSTARQHYEDLVCRLNDLPSMHL